MLTREQLRAVRKIQIRTSHLVSDLFAGAYQSVFKGRGIEFAEVRLYQPGDDVRTIDWNVSARTGVPHVKRYSEERELTVMLLVDASASTRFGSVRQLKSALAAELSAVLAFSAIRNNDKVGLILFTDEVEKFIPPRKGRKHVLRVIREILFSEPRRRGTDLNAALEFLLRVTPHHAIVVILSDFLESGTRTLARFKRQFAPGGSPNLAHSSYATLRQTNRRHDVVAVQIKDRYEEDLPALGRLVLKDAESGEVIEINTNDSARRGLFKQRHLESQVELEKLFRAANIDYIQLRTDQPYAATLGRFFENRERRRLRG